MRFPNGKKARKPKAAALTASPASRCGTGDLLRQRSADAALTLPLIADPGERWEYGIGMDWAGKAVEAVTGQKLGQYMKQNIRIFLILSA